MPASALLVAVIVLVIGGYVGWHIRHAYGANADLKVHKERIPRFRRQRARSSLISLAVVVITLLMLSALFRAR